MKAGIHTVFSFGLSAAVADYMKANNLTRNGVARKSGVSYSAIDRIKDSTSSRTFDALLVLTPILWTRSYCKLEERPRSLGKIKLDKDEDDVEVFIYKCLATPNLDAFAGIEGSWC